MDLRVKPIKYLVIHHTVNDFKDTQAVRQSHLNIGFGDVGYNSVVEKDGTIGKGRDIKWAGAHDKGVAEGETSAMNQIGYGIACIGNFEADGAYMKEPQYQGLLKEAHRVCVAFGIPIEKVVKHSNQFATLCPGKYFPWARFISDLSNLLKPVPIVVVTVDDPDEYLSVRVRKSKADALISQIISMGYACKKLPLA